MNNNFSITGYKDNSPDKNNIYNVIPGRNITMQGVSKQLTLIPIVNGQPQYDRKITAQPGDADIEFESDVEGVLEMPFAQFGGMLNPYTFQNTMYPINNLDTALDYARGISGNSYAENSNQNFQNPYVNQQVASNSTMTGIPPMVNFSAPNQGDIIQGQQSYLQGVDNRARTSELDMGALPSVTGDDNQRQLQEAQQVKTNQQNRRQPFIGAINPYGGWNMENTAAALGAFAQDKNILGVAASAGKLLLSGARNYFSGAGARKVYNESLQEYEDKMQNAERNQGWHWLQKGGTIGKILTGNFIEGDESHPNPNTEVEKGEYVQTPDGSTMEVIGKKHADGGELLNMPGGTKVVSDYLKVGSKTATFFKKEHGLNIKSNNSFATVLDKYKKKIGLTDLLDEEAKLMDKLNAQEDVEFEGTKEINQQVLSEKINELQTQKSELEDKFENFTNIVFDKQEQTKDPGESNFEKQAGGKINYTEKNAYIKANYSGVADKFKNEKLDPQIVISNLNNIPSEFQGADRKPDWMIKRDNEFRQGYLYHASKNPNINYENGKWVIKRQAGGELEDPSGTIDQNAQPVEQQQGSEIQQLIMQYAQITGQDPSAIVQQLQSLPEDQLQAAIQEIMQTVQQANSPDQGAQTPQDPNQQVQDVNAYTQPEDDAQPQMKKGGKILYAQFGTTTPVSDFDTYRTNYTWDANYEYGNLSEQAKAIIPFLQRNGIPFNQDDLKTQAGMDRLAGLAQQAFRNNFRGVSNDYSSKVASTQQGLQTALDQGLVTQKDLKNLGVKVDKGQVLRGSKGLVPKDNEQKLVDLITTRGKDKPEAYNKYVDNNFVDNKWYFRNPNIRSVEFNSQKEIDDYVKKNGYDVIEDVNGNKIYNTDKQGLYFNPVIKGKQTPVTDQSTTPTSAKTPDNPDPNANINPLGNRDRNYDNGLPMAVPDQSNLPPNYLPTTLRQIGSVQANAIRISPEETIKELNRQYVTAANLASETNPYTSGAMQANLQAQTNNATNQAYSQAALANAQDERAVANTNEERILQRDATNLTLASQYEKEAITGLDNYIQSWRNFIDKRNLENLNNWNLENQRQAFNAVNDNFKIGSMGWYQTDENPYIYYNGMNGLPPQGNQRIRQSTETTRTNSDGSKTKSKSETTTNPGKKQKGGLLLSNNIKNWLK